MAQATEANAPLLHRAIHNACDMSHYTPPLPGFDGPRAWNMVLAAMLRTTNRSKSERQYYKIAEYNQTRPEHRLQAGCDPDAFSKRALAFMIHIRPNMPQQYSDQDTADYPTDDNPADLFTKILSRQPFERHRKFVLNLAADAAVEQARVERQAKVDASSVREQTSKT